MRARLVPALIVSCALPFAACSSAPPSATLPADDAGATFSQPRDATVPDTAVADAKTPWSRMQPHKHRVLPTMRLTVVYLGESGIDGAESFDTFLDWLLSSDYWGILKQYGVDHGTRVASVRVSRASVIPAAQVSGGLITAEDLELAVHAVLHPGGSVDAGPDAFTDASDADGSVDASPEDGGDAATEAGPPPPPPVPTADAYIFFLPNGVNVNLGQRGFHTFQTCIDAGGYHAYDGDEPYAIIPPCTLGRSALAVSHELAEMATDPFPNEGWFSSADQADGGGEVGDLCNQVAPHGADGWDITQLWSNADGDCEPN